MADILILGGGVGGLVAANRLHRKLGMEHNISEKDL
jgi:2-polyprenyl-6-methoxyphenol hydroxylase-like FAD-dependent oxidoreductase